MKKKFQGQYHKKYCCSFGQRKLHVVREKPRNLLLEICGNAGVSLCKSVLRAHVETLWC